MARYGVPQDKRPADSPVDDGPKVIVTARLSPANKAKAHAIANGLGISLSALLNELVLREEVDEHGHVAWESRYAQPDPAQQALEMTA